MKSSYYVGYLTAGYPTLEDSIRAACAMVEGGVDILELGVPHSDPIADGPVITRAMQVALEQGITFDQVLEAARSIQSDCSVPIVLFSYYNVLLQQKDLFERIRAAGIDAVLVVDLPFEESADFYQQCLDHQIDPIVVIAPTTSPERCVLMKTFARRFVYYACRLGVTGPRDSFPSDFSENLAKIRKIFNLPVVAGFGIADRKLASEALIHADGFVVGSRIVSAIEEYGTQEKFIEFIRSIDPR